MYTLSLPSFLIILYFFFFFCLISCFSIPISTVYCFLPFRYCAIQYNTVHYSTLLPIKKFKNSNLQPLLQMNCEKPVREVAKMINSRDPKIHHHVRLSLFVLAEVINTLPNPQQFSGSPAAMAVMGSNPSSLWPLGVGVWALISGSGDLENMLLTLCRGIGNIMITLQAVSKNMALTLKIFLLTQLTRFLAS